MIHINEKVWTIFWRVTCSWMCPKQYWCLMLRSNTKWSYFYEHMHDEDCKILAHGPQGKPPYSPFQFEGGKKNPSWTQMMKQEDLLING